MPFQFTCPQGHLLEGAESQMGQQSQCPLCGVVFIVPVINSATLPPPGYAPPPGPWAPAVHEPAIEISRRIGPPPGAFIPPVYERSPAGHAGFPGIETGPRIDIAPPEVQPGPAGAPPIATEPPVIAAPPEPDPNRVVHLLCPNDHELHTPMSMIGQDALCPQCQVQFRLRYEDSLECKEEKRQERERRDAEFSRKALRLAIGMAVVVFLAIATMIAMSTMR